MVEAEPARLCCQPYQRLLQVATTEEQVQTEPPKEDHIDLPADIYGLTISVATSDLPHALEGSRTTFHLLRLFFGLACLAINVWLQLMIVMEVDRYIVARAVHNTQANYAQYHAEVFDIDGNFLADKWADWDGPKAKLCGMGLSKVKFTASIIFLWTIRMLSEVRSCLQLTHDIFQVPRTQPSTTSTGRKARATVAALNDNNEFERFDVMIIDMPARMCLASCVTIPKLIVGIALLYGGCRWFAATESWEDLILNALALEFVIGIDELIFEAFAPLRAKQTVEKTKLVHVHPEDSVGKTRDDKLVMNTLWRLLQLFLCMVWAYIYTTKLQQVIPNFPADVHTPCSGYLDAQASLFCDFMQESAECFPYGE